MFDKIVKSVFRKQPQMDEVLNIKIRNNRPVEINTLARSLNGISSLYREFLTDHDYIFEIEPKLYVKKIQEGSIDIYLIGQIATTLEFVNSMLEFCHHLNEVLEIFTRNKDIGNQNISKKECTSLHDFVDVTARDIDASLELSVRDNQGIIIKDSVININVTDANSAQNTIRNLLENMNAPVQSEHMQVQMYWADANFLSDKKHGQAIIESISNKPVGVKFAHEEDRKKCMSNHPSYPEAEWQDLLYTVDVEALYVQDKLKGYRILKVYDDVLSLIE